jgi:hypothetical protein
MGDGGGERKASLPVEIKNSLIINIGCITGFRDIN